METLNLLAFAIYIVSGILYLATGLAALVMLEAKAPRRLQHIINNSLFWVVAAWAFWPPVVLFILLYWLIKRPQPHQPPHYL